jgi:peptidyl-prolyl cis-trans isomerase D
MLAVFRKAVRSKASLVLIGLLILSFAVWGIADVFRGVAPGAVAEAGTREVRANEFEMVSRNFLNNYRQETGQVLTRDDAARAGALDQLFEQLLARKTLLAVGDKMGVGTSPEEIARILRTVEAFAPNGFFNRDAYRNAVTREGQTVKQFEAGLEEDLTSDKLTLSLGAAIVPPDGMIRAQVMVDSERRDIELFVISAEVAAAGVSPTEEKLTVFYDTRKAAFTITERRAISFVRIKPEDFQSDVQVPEARVLELYEQQFPPELETRPSLEDVRDQLIRAEQEGLSVDLFFDATELIDDAVGAGVPLEDLSTQLGTPVYQLASLDDRGRFASGDVAVFLSNPDVSDRIFAMLADEVTERLDLPDGSAIVIRLDSVTGSRVPELSEVRDRAIAAWTQDETLRLLGEAGNAARDRLAAGANITTLANTYASPVIPLEGLGPNRAPEVFSPAALNAVFVTKEGGAFVGPTSDGMAVLVGRVLKVTRDPGSQGSPLYASMSGQVRSSIEQDIQFVATQKARDAIQPKVNLAARAALTAPTEAE